MRRERASERLNQADHGYSRRSQQASNLKSGSSQSHARSKEIERADWRGRWLSGDWCGRLFCWLGSIHPGGGAAKKQEKMHEASNQKGT